MPFEVNSLLSGDARELLNDLTQKVRVFSAAQIGRTWPGLDSANRLKRLEENGLIVVFRAMVHPELPLNQPVAVWAPGAAVPDFAEVSYKLRSRWVEAGVSTPCVIASRATGRMFGGHGGRYPRESEETHDVHLAAIYLKLRSKEPLLAATWIHEEEIKSSRESRSGKLPDAILQQSGKIVEFGGAYKKAKLLAFHEYCQAQGLEYEVW
jgi:DNA-binding Lrp family transcriptional regulator